MRQLPASAGQVLLYGEDVTRDAAPIRTRKGMGRAFQLTNLFPNLTVLENVLTGLHTRLSANMGAIVLRLPGFAREERSAV